jgi:hypothetical protein
MPKYDTDQLTQKIEQAVLEHLAATERAATEAISRAFTARRPSAARPASTPSERASTRRRRSASELSAMCEQLSHAVNATPGETMTVLALGLGHSPRELNRPMDRLRQEGRVRSAGQRHLTRYYPLSPKG